jgi:hypothetical protein
LSEHFCEEKSGKASFDTLGKIFQIVLKVREGDVFFNDIYIEDMGLSEQEKEKYREKEESKLPVAEVPRFEELAFNPSSLNKFANFGDNE